MHNSVISVALCLTTLASTACSGKKQPAPQASNSTSKASQTQTAAPKRAGQSYSRSLLLSYAQFPTEAGGKASALPGAALAEVLSYVNGSWKTRKIEDKQSNVFHKAMPYKPNKGKAGIITLGAMNAMVKLWRWNQAKQSFSSQTLWQAKFGGKFDRMRDAEHAEKLGPYTNALAIATHDQGVVAIVHEKDGKHSATQLDHEKNTFIHEIEIGDLNKDGQLEVYATPSEPNKLGGDAQSGEVVRYDFAKGAKPKRELFAKLGNRHAKEILVDDVDGDGQDELYVAVEALTKKTPQGVEVVQPVSILRYDHDTPADKGITIATIDDRLCRFLTSGDVDGDGKKELVAAAFRSGLWMLSPGTNAKREWSIESIDKNSSGFEHAAAFADLDGDGRDELYVAADDQGELRQYRWKAGRPRKTVIISRKSPKSRLTWNITAIENTLIGPPRN